MELTSAHWHNTEWSSKISLGFGSLAGHCYLRSEVTLTFKDKIWKGWQRDSDLWTEGRRLKQRLESKVNSKGSALAHAWLGILIGEEEGTSSTPRIQGRLRIGAEGIRDGAWKWGCFKCLWGEKRFYYDNVCISERFLWGPLHKKLSYDYGCLISASMNTMNTAK